MQTSKRMLIKDLFIILTSGILLFPAVSSRVSIPEGFNMIAPQPAVFMQDFSNDLELEEVQNMQHSASPYWWLNSGAYFLQTDGVGKTWQGELPESSPWRSKYQTTDAGETDNGVHPQNIFRLVTRSQWTNFTQEIHFKINKYNLSPDLHRSASNGVLLFNRYKDGDNLYYVGVRVDGNAVVKKKIGGTYYTMAIKQVFPGTYNRVSNPNVLPVGTWMGLKSEVNNLGGMAVGIKVFLDRSGRGQWEEILQTQDDGQKFGGASLLDAGFGGIRTDFMDVEFDDYLIKTM